MYSKNELAKHNLRPLLVLIMSGEELSWKTQVCDDKQKKVGPLEEIKSWGCCMA